LFGKKKETFVEPDILPYRHEAKPQAEKSITTDFRFPTHYPEPSGLAGFDPSSPDISRAYDKMQKFFLSESTAARMRVFLHLVDATDGLTPETGEAAGQPQRHELSRSA